MTVSLKKQKKTKTHIFPKNVLTVSLFALVILCWPEFVDRPSLSVSTTKYGLLNGVLLHIRPNYLLVITLSKMSQIYLVSAHNFRCVIMMLYFPYALSKSEYSYTCLSHLHYQHQSCSVLYVLMK